MPINDPEHGGHYEPPAALLEMEDDSVDMIPPSRLRRSRRVQHVEGHLNVTSFVDVLSVLMFFLLTIATLEKLGTHDVNLPRESGAFDEDSDLEIRNLSIALARTRLTLQGMIQVGDEETKVLNTDIPTLGDSYDLEFLRRELMRLKGEYKTDEAIVLMVADDVHFDWVVKVLDTVKERVVYSNGQRLVTVLFPDVSMSDYLLDLDPEEGAEVAADATTDETQA